MAARLTVERISSFHSRKAGEVLETFGQHTGLFPHADDGKVQFAEYLGKSGHGGGEAVAVFDGDAHFVDNSPQGAGWQLHGVFLQRREHGQPQLQGLVEAVVEFDDVTLPDAFAKQAFVPKPVGMSADRNQGETFFRQFGLQLPVAGGDGVPFDQAAGIVDGLVIEFRHRPPRGRLLPGR